MRKRLLWSCFLFSYLLVLNISTISISQSSTGIETNITLNAFVGEREVPLNRTLALTVEIQWVGDIDLIEIGEVEEPVLTNFNVIGSSSSNRIMDSGGVRKAVKAIIYTLQPVNLGMAYIEPVSLSYTDKTTGKNHFLRTQRFQVEVLSPVAEPGERGPWWPWAALPLGVCGTGLLIYWLIKRMRNRKRGGEQPQFILEEIYLKELKAEVQLNASDRNEAIGVLTRLFRQYIADKYSVPALEATTGELLQQLNKTELDDQGINRCETLFKKSDIIRFSGHQATPSELSEAYTTVESILESNLRLVRDAMAEAEASKSKKHLTFNKNRL